jgi:hypothetical protein
VKRLLAIGATIVFAKFGLCGQDSFSLAVAPQTQLTVIFCSPSRVITDTGGGPVTVHRDGRIIWANQLTCEGEVR